MAGIAWADLAKAVLPGMQTAFMQGLGRHPTLWQAIGTKVPSTSKIETYPWVAWTKGPQEWKAEREPGGGEEHYLQVENKDYETSWRVWRNALRYKKYGQIKLEAGAKGGEMAAFIDELMLLLIAAAPTTATYVGDDATYVADTGHEEGASGSQDNLGTTALDPDALTAARVAGLNFKNAAGKPMFIRYDTLVVPPALEETADQLVGTQRGEVGNVNNTMNVHFGRYKVLVNPYMSDTTDWVLLDTSKFIMPFMWQEVQAPSPVEILEDKLKTEKWALYGSDMTGAASFTLWPLIYYSQVAGG